MRIREYPFESVRCCFCGWDDDGDLSLTPVEPEHDEDWPAPVVSVNRCGGCGEDLAHDLVEPRPARRQPARPRVRKPIRDRRHRCAAVGVA